jgi:VCBS repeat-containing protein
MSFSLASDLLQPSIKDGPQPEEALMDTLRNLLSSLARAGLIAVLTGGLVLSLVPTTQPPAAPLFQRAGAVVAGQGYWLVAADGGVFPFGDARAFGPNRNQGPDIVGMARTADGQGYWHVDEDGDVFRYGNAPNFGSRLHNADDVVGFVARPQGDGYWIVASDGGTFSFGGAAFHGSTGGIRLNQPIVGMASTPSGRGYWLVASDGGIFAFGDAGFHGSTGGIRLNRPIVGMASTDTGNGYWLVASDGGLFAFGDAGFHGSTGDIRLARPIVGMASTGTGNGYWLVASDGGIFGFGDAAFHGSTGALALNQPIVGMVALPPVPVDEHPVAAADSVTVEEDASGTVDVLANDSGLGDGGIAVGIVDNPDHGTAVVTAGGRITYTPARDYAGADSLTYRITDNDGDAATANLHVTVTGRNDAPVATDRSLSTGEDTPLTGTLTATDADRDTLTFVLATPAGHGSAMVDGSGAFTYTPAADYAGQDSFVVTVDDGHGGTDTAIISVTVGGANDPPTIVAIADQAITEDGVTDVIAFTVGDPDHPASALTVSASSSDPTLVPSIGITLGGSGADRTVTVTPAGDANGAAVITITVDDGAGGSAQSAFTVTVAPLNDPPTIGTIGNVSIVLGTSDSGVLAFTVGDVDDPAGSLTVTATSSDPALVPNSELNLALGGSAADRTLVVVPAPGVAGTTDITVSVSDGTSSRQTTFTFTVVPA